MILDLWLARCPRLFWDRKGRLPAYLGCGTLGFLVAFLLLYLLFPRHHGLLVWIVPSTLVAFLSALKLGSVLFREKRTVCYRVTLFVLTTVLLFLWVCGLPVLQCADLLMLGISTFLLFGRIGCLQVGCCHGRPARHGIRYPKGHADAGFPAYLVGTPLLPIQLLESLGALVLSVWGAWQLRFQQQPGLVFAGILGGYGLLRYTLELGRGDATRPMWGELSEGQWTALLLAWILVAFRHQLGLPSFLMGSALLLSLVSLGLFVFRGTLAWTPFWLSDPSRVLALYQTVAALGPKEGAIVTAQTPYGLKLSLSMDPANAAVSRHYGLSRIDGVLNAKAASVVAEQIRRCFSGRPMLHLQPGRNQGIFHLSLYEP